ncbi:Arrestin domain-containing protein 3 [Frankliniella fusca]|uniref:Arrestin domain-containing protein 3 n=1 Tax=Frankliniella fusca TaxID=407009 RepID=A0AAE1L8C8_9NEOP|nr:Arrestin domain-containing protein 3 [Frankliniella fusca]
MPTSIRISFDRPEASYFAGETITGRVHLHLDTPKNVRAVKIDFQGGARVRWTEHHSTGTGKNRRTSTRTYYASETYFSSRGFLVGNDVGEITLTPGDYVYPFQCELPNALPSSFEGAHGHVRYTVKAVVDRPWKFDHSARAAFTVVSPLDLNMYPQAKEPIICEQSKYFCCLWCRSGPLTLSVRVPNGGYVPGQDIPLQIQVDNASTTEVYGVRGALNQIVRFHATTRSKATTQRVMDLVFSSKVEGHSSKVYLQQLRVPPLPPSFLTFCRIIDVDYQLTVSALVGGAHINLTIQAPILIGTFPLVVSKPLNLNLPGPSDPRGGAEPPPYPGGPLPSAPPPPGLPSPDLPPPSYEECLFKGNSIMDTEDGDNQYTMGHQAFTPRYPVWNLIGWNVPHSAEDVKNEN